MLNDSQKNSNLYIRERIKVLWLSNVGFSNDPIRSGGTWLTAMGRALLSTGEIELFNITQSKSFIYTKESIGPINQWLVPFERLENNGLPSLKTLNYIQTIVKEVKPDIIHIWGTENYWGLLTARGYIKGRVLLEIQGLRYTCAKVYSGGLTFSELLKCIGLKEILKPSKFILSGKIQSKKWGFLEKEMLKNHNNISTQSEWIRANVSLYNNNCMIYETGMILRDEFIKSTQWQRKDINPVIFASCANLVPYKGFHILFKALSHLKLHYPNIILRIAGKHVLNGMKTGGYSKFLKNEAIRLGIIDSIEWLGPLSSNEIISYFYSCSVVVIPSFIESYSMALAEAMIVGVATVVAFSGAMPELAENNVSALFYPASDDVMCSYQIDKIIKNERLAKKLSHHSRMIGIKRNNTEAIVNHQLEIYRMLIHQ